MSINSSCCYLRADDVLKKMIMSGHQTMETVFNEIFEISELVKNVELIEFPFTFHYQLLTLS